jgi:hypothetical protein
MFLLNKEREGRHWLQSCLKNFAMLNGGMAAQNVDQMAPETV